MRALAALALDASILRTGALLCQLRSGVQKLREGCDAEHDVSHRTFLFSSLYLHEKQPMMRELTCAM